MGIYTNRGFEYLVRVDKADKKHIDYLVANYNGRYYPQFDAVSLVEQRFTDDRLVLTKYFKELEKSWFFYANPFAKPVDVDYLEDFPVLEEEKQMIQKIADDTNLSGLNHGWFDVNHVSTTYDF